MMIILPLLPFIIVPTIIVILYIYSIKIVAKGREISYDAFDAARKRSKKFVMIANVITVLYIIALVIFIQQ